MTQTDYKPACPVTYTTQPISLPFGGTRISKTEHYDIQKWSTNVRELVESLLTFKPFHGYVLIIQPNLDWKCMLLATPLTLAALAKLPNVAWVVDPKMDMIVKIYGSNTTLNEIRYKELPSTEPINGEL